MVYLHLQKEKDSSTFSRLLRAFSWRLYSRSWLSEHFSILPTSSWRQKGMKKKWKKPGKLLPLVPSDLSWSHFLMLLLLLFHDFHSKYMMKFFSLILITFSLCLPVFASTGCSLENKNVAEFLNECAQGTVGIDPSGTSSNEAWVQDRITKIAKWAISLGALLAVGAIVWAGIQYVKAFGDDEQLKKAKTTGIYAVIGLLLMMASFWLVDIFINFLFQITSK